MKRAWLVVMVLTGAFSWAQSTDPPGTPPSTGPASVEPGAGSPEHLRACIERHLGRPYVWGATGLKSFDCSGFVWRTMLEHGVFLKRTTARKYFMCLKKVDEKQKWSFPNLVFFDDLQHVGIVNDKGTFYHSQSSRGTNLSSFDPYWRGRVCGFRAMPVSGLQGPPTPPPPEPGAATGRPTEAPAPGSAPADPAPGPS